MTRFLVRALSSIFLMLFFAGKVNAEGFKVVGPKIDPDSLPNSKKGQMIRYELFKSMFEPIECGNPSKIKYRLACWEHPKKAYILSLVEGPPESFIILQEFVIREKVGPPIWIKSAKTKKYKVRDKEIQKLYGPLTPAFEKKEYMGTPGLAGHFWLEKALDKESDLIDLYYERFDGEKEFFKRISRYVPYLPEMPVNFDAPKAQRID